MCWSTGPIRAQPGCGPADGQQLLWRNVAARRFHGKGKRRSGEHALPIVPIRGQIGRLIRLGSLNRSSLSRMQFLLGERPVSATCTCTPMLLATGETALLVVGVDPVMGAEPAQRAPAVAEDPVLLGGTDYLALDGSGHILAGSPRALASYAAALDLSRQLPGGEGRQQLDFKGTGVGFEALTTGNGGATLLLFDPAPEGLTLPEAETAAGAAEPAPVHGEPQPAPLPPPDAPAVAPSDQPIEPVTEPGAPADAPAETAPGALSSLFDRLASDEALYAPLRDDEEFELPAGPAFGPPDIPGESGVETNKVLEPVVSDADDAEPAIADEPAAPDEELTREPELLGSEPEVAAAPSEPEPPVETEKPTLFRIVGRGFTPSPATGEAPSSPPIDDADAPSASPQLPALLETDLDPELPQPLPDRETVERVSRYNFDELGRILNDRIAGRSELDPNRAAAVLANDTLPSAMPTGELVTLSGETLVLNRLPLGILVFRDQQILFANRAITAMIGYDSADTLRQAGLATIFPASGDAQQAGPVNHLVRPDGTLLPVTARLQSVSWQGKPALMLSASATEVRTGHETAVRAFAELLAVTRGDGFIEAARSGVITAASSDARLLLGRTEEQLIGRPLTSLIATGEADNLRSFLERPARFAETARPAITLKGNAPGLELLLFAQGQAGVIANYFGFVRRVDGAPLPAAALGGSDADPALLTRLSRGVRRPLNTVIGFSDLIGSAAFGPVENPRYVEYAHDIKSAGLEIAALVDELDDLARLRDGRYATRPTQIDLQVLLDTSVTRVRGLANTGRVLLRSAISERLPRIRADRASLAQAILNLLASAVDETPQDGSVVLSAQLDERGGITVNVRDSAQGTGDLGERFVVFRDGVGRDGEPLMPVRSTVGLALTRALLAVNSCRVSVESHGSGTLFSLTIPRDQVITAEELPAGAS